MTVDADTKGYLGGRNNFASFLGRSCRWLCLKGGAKGTVGAPSVRGCPSLLEVISIRLRSAFCCSVRSRYAAVCNYIGRDKKRYRIKYHHKNSFLVQLKMVLTTGTIHEVLARRNPTLDVKTKNGKNTKDPSYEKVERSSLRPVRQMYSSKVWATCASCDF